MFENNYYETIYSYLQMIVTLIPEAKERIYN